jgi:hypothetical protein
VKRVVATARLAALLVVVAGPACNRGPDAETRRRTATVAEALRPSFFAAALRRVGGAHFQGTAYLAAAPAANVQGVQVTGGMTTTTDVWLDRGGSYHLRELNDSDGGREVFFTGRELAVALRYGKMIRRAAEEPEPMRLLEEGLGAPWAAWEIVAPSATVERAGTELFGGARATRYRLGRSKNVRAAVSEEPRGADRLFGVRAWRGSASVTALSGDLVIDDATGALMNADIVATFAAEEEGQPLKGMVETHTVLTEVATTPPIERPPAEDLALRQRIVPEQRDLLKGLPSSARLSEPPPPKPAPPVAQKRRPVRRKAKP